LTTSPLDVLRAFTRLGLTSFGGPVAHIGYFHREFVERRRWLDAAQFAHLLALCQTLPGPISSQLGFAIGLLRAGWLGALAAFVAFTLPSATVLFLLASSTAWLQSPLGTQLAHALKLVAVAVVAHGLVQLARRLTPDTTRASIGSAALIAMLVAGSAWMQIVVIAGGALAGAMLLRGVPPSDSGAVLAPVRPGTALGALVLFGAGLGLAMAWSSQPAGVAAIFAAFWRAGSFVFGGGHVVLPLLEQSVVAPGWVAPDLFLSAYGVAQAVPGPMFSVAAFLGAEIPTTTAPAVGAVVATLAIFGPGFLLLVAALPTWNRIASDARATRAVAGICAAVVGLLGAAFINPVWTSGVVSLADGLVAAGGFALLLWGRSALLVVAWCVAGVLLAGGLR
jgi:chromate transporter